MTKIQSVFTLWGTCIFIGLIAACSVDITPGYIDDDKKAVELNIAEFHTQLGNREFEAVYQSMHPAFQASAPKEEQLRRLVEISTKYGKMKRVLDSRIEIIVGAPVQARAVYNTKFEKQDATEMFGFVKEARSYKLMQYGIWPGVVTIPKEKK